MKLKIAGVGVWMINVPIDFRVWVADLQLVALFGWVFGYDLTRVDPFESLKHPHHFSLALSVLCLWFKTRALSFSSRHLACCLLPCFPAMVDFYSSEIINHIASFLLWIAFAVHFITAAGKQLVHLGLWLLYCDTGWQTLECQSWLQSAAYQLDDLCKFAFLLQDLISPYHKTVSEAAVATRRHHDVPLDPHNTYLAVVIRKIACVYSML